MLSKCCTSSKSQSVQTNANGSLQTQFDLKGLCVVFQNFGFHFEIQTWNKIRSIISITTGLAGHLQSPLKFYRSKWFKTFEL